MDIRNIQKTGGQSFVVTLPKNWIVTNFMKDKDKVKVFNHKRYLNIIPFAYKKVARYPICQIDSLSKKQIEREIIGHYLSGADNIVVKGNSITYEQRAAVREISFRLIGCECLESTTNQMLLKNSPDQINLLMPEYVVKMISIIISMYRDTINYLDQGDRAMARDIIERDMELDRLHLSIVRSNNIRLNEIEIEENGTLSLFDSHFYEIVAIRLERIGDHVVKIAENFILTDKNYKSSSTPIEKTTIKNGLKNLSICQKILSSLDKKQAHFYLDIFDETVNAQSSKKYVNHDYFNLVIAESIGRINSYIANISEEVINYSNIKSELS